MFGNLKEFISVVHDGLSANNNLRQTLQDVQKVTKIFKEKQRPVSESKVNYGVGGDLLDKYQDNWSEIHRGAEENAQAADEADKAILQLHETAKMRLQSASEMAQNLSYLPSLAASVAQCIDSMKHIQSVIKQVEDDLVDMEDVFERNKMEKWKLDHHYHLSLYKEKKLAALEEVRNQLAKENTERSSERERKQLAELQQRQETSAVAFQVDVAKYMTMGIVPSGAPVTPNNQITLDQIQLELDEDSKDLEQFLDS